MNLKELIKPPKTVEDGIIAYLLLVYLFVGIPIIAALSLILNEPIITYILLAMLLGFPFISIAGMFIDNRITNQTSGKARREQ